MSQHTFEPGLPALSLTIKELTEALIKILKNRTGATHFNGIVTSLAEDLAIRKFGFLARSHTTYDAVLEQVDVDRVREIIWDFIILRYLTPGGNGHNEWPSLTITERGQIYFITELAEFPQ